MSAATAATARLLEDFSLEMTAKDAPELGEVASVVPAGTRMNVTFLGTETVDMRMTGVKAVVEAGLVPVPHIAARRLESPDALAGYLELLRGVGAAARVFLVGGDPRAPLGPYNSALEVIRGGRLPEHGVREVLFAGYPDGHPDIATDVLWRALVDKHAAVSEQGMTPGVITQFGFDASSVLRWIEDARDRGVVCPVRVGVPGPAGVRRLLAFAARFGVAASVGVARKYGLSLTNLMGSAGPDRFVDDLASGLDPQRHGEVRVHFYTFGGVAATSRWIREHLEAR